jgi:hypothetical protein
MKTQSEMVLNSLVESYKLIKSLSARIDDLETKTSSLPWDEKSETKPKSSYNTSPAPTPAIRNLANNTFAMKRMTLNDTSNYWKRMRNGAAGQIDQVVIWKNGVVTTLGENINTSNPLAVFRSRACANLRLRKAGWHVPMSKGSKDWTIVLRQAPPTS